ncbi:hypothetical protein PALB_27870 [Pseudoalteromonas luteoviolacea B = ATCC 29581]|nr:hypothetical protein PALB_27870 [Pseudoalteromonas luteoviolacea B = ATCC 29581]
MLLLLTLGSKFDLSTFMRKFREACCGSLDGALFYYSKAY